MFLKAATLKQELELEFAQNKDWAGIIDRLEILADECEEHPACDLYFDRKPDDALTAWQFWFAPEGPVESENGAWLNVTYDAHYCYIAVFIPSAPQGNNDD